MQHSVWAIAHLSDASEATLRSLFRNTLGYPSKMIKRGLHITIYHARRPLAGITDSEEPIAITVPGSELRMMALAPGGDNARPDVDPRLCLIGLRIRRADGAADAFEALRARFLAYETEKAWNSLAGLAPFERLWRAQLSTPHHRAEGRCYR